MQRTDLVRQHKIGPRSQPLAERTETMTTHSSAQLRDETPHVTNSITNKTISDAVKRRAQSLIKDRTIDASERGIIRYALEINDPYLPELVRWADAGESITDTLDSSQEPEANEDDSSEEKIEALAGIICRAGDQSAAALLVIMGMLEDSAHPKVLANTAKHFAFTRCGELNLYRMVDVQIAVIEGELLADNALTS